MKTHVYELIYGDSAEAVMENARERAGQLFGDSQVSIEPQYGDGIQIHKASSKGPGMWYAAVKFVCDPPAPAEDHTTAFKMILSDLLAQEERRVRESIRSNDVLSEPVPEGHWRWADLDNSGYRRKSEEELAADRERARNRAQASRATLETLGLLRSELKEKGML